MFDAGIHASGPTLVWEAFDPRMKGSVLTDPNQPGTDPAGLRGPGDPDAADAGMWDDET